jgi:glycosyltransferase involved in cell wall biosynthesis
MRRVNAVAGTRSGPATNITTRPHQQGRPEIESADRVAPRSIPRRAPSTGASARVRIDGKQFWLGDEAFRFRGVTYGTFAPRGDGALFPEREQLKQDFASICESGFTVLRTYTPPPDDLVDLSADWGLRVMADVFYPDWRYLVGASRRQYRRVVDEARRAVRDTARRFAGSEQLVALSLGNEIPADVLRWFGAKKIAGVVDELVDVVREEDPAQLVTYANYPTAEYLSLPNLDFLTFNVFLERRQDFRRYLTRLQHLAGDRPLVLGEVGLDAGTSPGGERHQARTVDWQLETAIERGVAGTCVFSWTDEWCVAGKPVEGWHFGLTREDRSPRQALRAASKWNKRTVRDLDFNWPSMTVVICAYNAEPTLEECLRHTCALDYPNLEIVVVDDGSTDLTAAIVRRHPRARLVSILHCGLSVARNEGFSEANGELIAYLDSDAYPTPEWPYYLALGLDGNMVAGVGGPNLPPASDDRGAHQVARAPGGPVHVLVSDDRAEHIPGCNMAFWKKTLTEVGGFDPIYTSAGDDVDLCWKVLDRGYDIAFHPAALVWHHRRPGLRAYLRQQRGYGRSEALVEARHPNRFTPAGTARWRGRIYNSLSPSLTRQRIYRGIYGAAAYQSVYQGGGHALDLLHQAGIPIAVMLMATAPLAIVWPVLGVPALVALLAVFIVGGVDAARAAPPRTLRQGRLRFRLGVAAMHVLQPLHRSWGRGRARTSARRDVVRPAPLPAPIRRVSGGSVLYNADRPREEFAAQIITTLRLAGIRIISPTGWEDHDGTVLASRCLTGQLLSSGHPVGYIQLRVRRSFQYRRIAILVTACAGLSFVHPLAAGGLAALTSADIGTGWLRTGPAVRRALRRATAEAAR